MSNRKTYKDQILDLLRSNRNGLTNRQISQRLGIPQNQVHVACRDLQRAGLLVKERKGKPSRMFNIAVSVQGDESVASEPEWKQYISSMAAAQQMDEGELLDNILTEYGELILEETPEHEKIVSFIRSEEGKPDREILNEALTQYLESLGIEYEPWEMKAQIIAEKRRESTEEVFDAAVKKYFADKFVQAMSTGGGNFMQMMQNVNQQPNMGESADGNPETRPDIVNPVEGQGAAQTPAGHAVMPGVNPNGQHAGRQQAETVPRFNAAGTDDSAFGV